MSLDELREQQPQIFLILRTEFRTVIVGFEMHPRSRNGKRDDVFEYLPPRPPQIHQSVYPCKPEEIIHFMDKLEFLQTLLQVNWVPAASLIAASVREIYRLRKADREWLIKVGRMISMLLKDDYDRLRYILSQIHW